MSANISLGGGGSRPKRMRPLRMQFFFAWSLIWIEYFLFRINLLTWLPLMRWDQPCCPGPPPLTQRTEIKVNINKWLYSVFNKIPPFFYREICSCVDMGMKKNKYIYIIMRICLFMCVSSCTYESKSVCLCVLPLLWE